MKRTDKNGGYYRLNSRIDAELYKILRKTLVDRRNKQLGTNLISVRDWIEEAIIKDCGVKLIRKDGKDMYIAT